MTEAEFAAANQRHGELVNNQYARQLTTAEAEEVAALARAIDAHFAGFYAPILARFEPSAEPAAREGEG